MNLRKLTLLTLTFATLSVPALSQASAMWHPANNERGFTQHPDHFKSSKTRGEVTAEFEAARKNGTLDLHPHRETAASKQSVSNKTREQVLAEVVNETAAERKFRLMQMSGS